METQPDPARKHAKQASREATEWSVLLREDPGDPALRHRFEAWRAASPVHAEAWQATARASDLAAEALPAFRHEWPARHAGSARRLRLPRPRWAVAAASLALAAVVAFAAVPGLLLRLQADHVAATAEIRDMTLDDGSRLTLAPGSAIAVAFAATERRVRLLKGEAFFAVEPDAGRPFRVTAGGVETTVLGTRFDVRLDDRAVLVGVEEGTVRVASAAGTAVLTARASLRIDASGMHQGEAPELASAWRRGQLYVQNRPLGEAIDTLRRYVEGGIVIADRGLAERPVTGVFNLSDPEAALRGMAEAHGAKVRRVTPWLTVVSAF